MSEILQGGAGAPSATPATPTTTESAGGSGSIGAPAPTATPDHFEVTINGRTERVPLDELRKGYSRHSDYTRKTQELAERERMYQGQITQYEAALQEIKTFLEDRSRLEQYMKSYFAEQQAAAQGASGPDEYITAQNAQQLMQQQAAQLQQQTQQQLQQLQHQFHVQQLQADYTPKIEAKISALKQAFPELQSPRVERALRLEVLQRQPQDVESALGLLDEVAREIASDLGNVFKSKVVSGQGGHSPTPLNNGIEPKGGQGPMPTPQPNFKKVTDPGLRELVMQDLLNSVKNRG